MNSKSEHSGKPSNLELSEKLLALEQRVAKLESGKSQESVSSREDDIGFNQLSLKVKTQSEGQLESSIGEYGLAWLGNIVLFFGISFFVQYLQNSGYEIISSAFGFVAVAGVFGLAHYFRNSNSYMARVFNLNAYLLVFYVTLKLHFFTTNPVITSNPVGIVLILFVCGILLYLSIRKKYTLLAGLTFILISFTAVLSDSTYVLLSLLAMLAIISVVILYKFGWLRLVFLSIFLVYFVILLWMSNNPIMGHPMQIISDHQSGYIYVFFVAAIFSLIALMPAREELYGNSSIIGAVIFNGLGFFFITTLLILSFFNDNYVLLTGSIAVYCLIYSILLQIRSEWKITAAFYALFGFVTLSVSIFGIYGFPRAYYLLAIQSLLVLSMAIWFRSKFIVIMNSLLFIIILMIYITTSPAENLINISFSIVALATARILNWKKERLTINTEFIRNFYLITTFLMVLWTLYHLLPNQYITLSWTVAAVIYFIFSIILKNGKYRYMALGTMIAAAFFLLLVDLARIELIYRVITLIFLAIISIGLSFYYAKKLKKKTELK